jgi:translation initiation factor eIF-2B subunit delta
MSTFADDRTSGSSDVALAFLAELERWAAIDVSTTAPAFRIALLTFLRGAQAAQPSMALVHQLAARALEVTDAGGRRGETPPALRDEIARTCEAERGDLARVRMALARQACGLLDRREPWIATVSSSGAVREALLEAQRRNLAPRALVAEGRPLLEGREMARVLAQAGLPVWLMADAALPMLIGQATQVWIGADAITDQGVLNKVGSFALALAAREHSVPVYAIAERRKLIPATTPALRIVEMPPEEIWDEPAAGVRPRNVYFEVVPMGLLRGIVVEDAVLPPGEAALTARERPLPDELMGAGS